MFPLANYLLCACLALAASPAWAWHYGVVTDLAYTCNNCMTVFMSDYWVKLVQRKDAQAVLLTDLATGPLQQQLETLDVVVFPLSNANTRALTDLPVERLQALKDFIERGGIVISQNAFNDGPTSNSTFLSKLLNTRISGFKYESSLRKVTVTPQALAQFPGIPAALDNNMHIVGFNQIGPEFTPVYTVNDTIAVAAGTFGIGGVIMFGLAEDAGRISASHEDVLEYLIQVLKAPVF